MNFLGVVYQNSKTVFRRKFTNRVFFWFTCVLYKLLSEGVVKIKLEVSMYYILWMSGYLKIAVDWDLIF